MIYSCSFVNRQLNVRKTPLAEIRLSCRPLMKSIEQEVDYYVYEVSDTFVLVGLLHVSTEDACIIDLYNCGVSTRDFFILINELIARSDKNLYAVPNENGGLIWNVLGFKSASLRIVPSLRKLFAKNTSHVKGKYLYLNRILGLTVEYHLFSLKSGRSLFYSKRVPRQILLDTF